MLQCSNYTVDFGGAHLFIFILLRGGGGGVFVRLRVDL